jgi:precorrin-3B C17-methyltransferase
LAVVFIVSTGPGGTKHLTTLAKEAIEKSEVIVGYKKYLDDLRDLIANKEQFS